MKVICLNGAILSAFNRSLSKSPMLEKNHPCQCGNLGGV
jgi:hypothetical protein